MIFKQSNIKLKKENKIKLTIFFSNLIHIVFWQTKQKQLALISLIYHQGIFILRSKLEVWATSEGTVDLNRIHFRDLFLISLH